MRVVLDSGILIRAADSEFGLARQLLLAVLGGNHTLVLSGAILFEVAKVLRYPRFQKRNALTDESIYRYVSYLREAADMVVIDPSINAPIRDPNDVAVVQTAILGEAEVLCTIDPDFMDTVVVRYLDQFGIAVMTDTELIRRLRT